MSEVSPVLRYGSEISRRDVESLKGFLIARSAHAAASEKGSDERHMAKAVRSALLHVAGVVEHALPYSRDSVGVEEKTALPQVQIQFAWNVMCDLATPWQWRDDYDAVRWRHVRHWDAQQESHYEILLRHTVADEN